MLIERLRRNGSRQGKAPLFSSFSCRRESLPVFFFFFFPPSSFSLFSKPASWIPAQLRFISTVLFPPFFCSRSKSAYSSGATRWTLETHAGVPEWITPSCVPVFFSFRNARRQVLRHLSLWYSRRWNQKRRLISFSDFFNLLFCFGDPRACLWRLLGDGEKYSSSASVLC